MKHLRKTVLAIIIITSFTSCAFHSGVMTANLPTDFDQEIVGRAEGRASTVHVFLIGGLDHKYLVTDAKKNLYANYPLKKGESYANLVVDYRFFPYECVFVTQAFVTADIVVDHNVMSDTLQAYFEPRLNEKALRTLSKDGIWVEANDEVLVKKRGKVKSGRVLKVLSKKKVLCSSPTLGNKKYKLGKFFLPQKENRFVNTEYFVGDTVLTEFKGETSQGTIVGMNYKNLLVRYQKGHKKQPINLTNSLFKDQTKEQAKSSFVAAQ